MRDTPEILAARAEANRRRSVVMASAQELQERLSPKVLAKGAWQGAKERGADLAEDAVDAVKARPAAVGGVAAAIAMFLAREPIKDAAVKIYDAMTSRGDTKKRPAALMEADDLPDDGPAPRPARAPRAAFKTETMI